MLVCRRQNHNINIASKLSDNVKIQTFGETLTHENCMLVEFKSKLNLRAACCHSVQIHLYFCSPCALWHIISKNAILKCSRPDLKGAVGEGRYLTLPRATVSAKFGG
jgi:hypothetical protein